MTFDPNKTYPLLVKVGGHSHIVERDGTVAEQLVRRTDPNVELKALLKEVLGVLRCHHRNTHKPLIDRSKTTGAGYEFGRT